MPDVVNHIIVEATTPVFKVRGTRNQTNLEAAFPGSPIIGASPTLNDNDIRTFYVKEVTKIQNQPIGNGIQNFTPRFFDNLSNQPNGLSVDLATHNLPSEFMPNISSPGPNNGTDHTQKPEYKGDIPNPQNKNFGTGLGSAISFSDVTKRLMAGQQNFFDLESGESFQGSDGS